MGQIALQVPISGQPNSTEDPKIASDLTTIQTWANGNVDQSNLGTGAALMPTSTMVNRHIKFGTSSTFTAGSWLSGTWTTFNVPHGLGLTPFVAMATATTGGSTVANVPVTVNSCDGTNILVWAYNASGINLTGGTIVFNWVALY